MSQFYDVAIDVEETDIDPDDFEKSLLLHCGHIAVSVTYDWGVTVFFPIMEDDFSIALSRCIQIVRQTGAIVIGAEITLTDQKLYAITDNAYRTSCVG